jgi:drug/metabolite transporter (DMT)-like permease
LQINKSKYTAEANLLLVTLFWGATFVVVKEAIEEISPLVFITFRFAIAGIILSPFVIKKRFDRKSILSGMLLGTLLFLGFALQTVGLKYTPATKSGFLTGTAVILIPILQVIIEKRLPTKGVIVGSLVVMLGVTFLSSGGNSVITLLSDFGTNFNLGDALTLLSALFFALYIIYIDVETSKFDFWVLLFVQILTVAFFGVIFSFFLSLTEIEPIRITFTTNTLFALFYTSIFATLITTALQTKFQKNVTPTKAGIIFAFEPLFAAIFAFFLLGEKLSNFGYIGAALIIIGLLISELYENLVIKENGTN